jgi:hypothetical protein
VANYLYYRGASINANNDVDELINYVNDLEWDRVENDDELFVFGGKFGNGADDDHFQIGFTSIVLLERIFISIIFRIDCTYKIIKYFYPVIVFGITDINHKFFPIAFMITSHETEADFKWYFNTLKDLIYDVFSYKFEPQYIMSDAASAIYNAAKSVFPNTIMLMCYFHVKYNVRKKKSTYGQDYSAKIHGDSLKLHLCTSAGEFQSTWKTIKSNWSKKVNLKELTKYAALILTIVLLKRREATVSIDC